MEAFGVAVFSLGSPIVSENGQTVRWGPGKLFELGAWPPAPNRPAGFSLNAVEADAVIQEGWKVPIEIEHFRSIFDGKLGHAEFTGRNGVDLLGVLMTPKALADLIGSESSLAVSMVWDPATKKPLRCGLVLNPEITDAEVAAAFSATAARIDTEAIYARLNAPPVASAHSGSRSSGIDPKAIYDRLNGRA